MDEQERIRLVLLIEEGDFEAARKILTESHHAKLVMPVGRLQVIAPQLAAWQGRIDLLELLYARGVDVNAPDKIGRRALYHAAQRGNVEVVKWLLQHGACPEARIGLSFCSMRNTCAGSSTPECVVGKTLPLPECWGRTALHQAVKNNHAEVVRILMEAGAPVNVEDECGITPILLAGSVVSPDDAEEMAKFEMIIDTLISAKASVTVKRPDTGTTALHHAAGLGSAQATTRLLDAGACALAQCTDAGRTPLHVAASSGRTESIRVLLTKIRSYNIDIRDQNGCTPLCVAASKGQRESVRFLIQRGANLAAETKSGKTAVRAIFTYMSKALSLLTDILDSQVRSATDTAFGRIPYIIVDFSVLTPRNQRQMAVVMAMVTTLSDKEQVAMMQHPLMETFLRLKWKKLRIFFFIFTFLHVCFIVSLSIFSILVIYHLDLYAPQYVLICTSSIIICNLIVELLMLPRYYLKQLETWLSLSCALISLASVAGFRYIRGNPPHDESGKSDCQQYHSQWVLVSMSVAILLGWMQMMMVASRLPTFGYYVLMFTTVLKNILKVLLAFVCLIVGFALSFAVLFHGNDQFYDLWRAVVKTVVMMVGEYEYGDLFPAMEDEDMFLAVTSRIIFLAFVLITSIALMNLMIGLAVNDIQGLEKEGHIRRLLKQAEYVAQLEMLISHKIFRCNWLHPRIRAFVNRRRLIPRKIVLGSRENGLRESFDGIPSTLMESLLNLAIKNSAEDPQYTSGKQREKLCNIDEIKHGKVVPR